MSDTNRLRLSYVEEVTFGITPSAALQDLRFTSESLKQDTDAKVSDEIRFDRQNADVFRTSVGASGQLGIELSGAQHDDFLESAIGSAAWSSVVTSTEITYSATGANTFDDSANGFIAAGFLVNQWIFVSGFTVPANNGFFKITTVAAGVLTVAGITATSVEAAGASITITMGGQIVNGTTLKSYSIEKQFVDLTTTYSIYTGMVIENMDLRIAVGEAVNGNFSFLGVKETSAAASGGSGYTVAGVNPIVNAIDNILGPLEGGAAAGTQSITEFDISTRNNNRARMEVGNVGPVSVGQGSFEATGSLRKFFATSTLYDKYLNFTDTSLSIIVQDTATPYRYVFDFPKINFSDGGRVAGGKDQDILADLSWMASMHATELITMRVVRFLV